MTQDEIIEMAREAATEDGSVKRTDGKNVVIYAAKTNRFLERFAALVALAEREACAMLCENMAIEWEDQPQFARVEIATMMDCALAIRNRGEQT